jgi:iron(III) transport system permease protein
MTLAQAFPLRIRGENPGVTLLFSVTFAIVAGLILGPVLFLIVNSFRTALPGMPATWGLDFWREALGESEIWGSVWNSIRLYLATSVASWPIALMLAWILGRTDIPGARAIEFLFWLSFFLPSLTVAMGWVTLIDPDSGLVNQAIRHFHLYGGKSGPFNIYTFWGLVWVHLGQNAIAVKTILLVPAFRNLDSMMEEASRLSGAGVFRTLRRVVFPMMGPAIIITALLGFVRMWQSFEVELVLGIPQGFYVYGTKIYDLLNSAVPEYGQATVLAVLAIGVALPFMVFQQRFSLGRRYETISGRARAVPTPLGRARVPVLIIVLIIAFVASVLPMIAVTGATFMVVFGHFDLSTTWTIANWTRVLEDPVFLQCTRNTIVIAGSAALLGVTLSALVAYIVVRTNFRLRAQLDVITWIPQALPGMLIGLGTLWVALTFLRPLYGSLVLLVAVTVISGMTLGVQIIKSNMIQLGTELEEASRLSGGSWFYTFRRVVLPPLKPVLVLVGTLDFVIASRDVSNIVLLASGPSKTLALLQVDYMLAPYWESAAVVAVVMMAISTGIALIARVCHVKLGMH